MGALSQTALHVSAERREPRSCPFPVDTENSSVGMNLDSDVLPPKASPSEGCLRESAGPAGEGCAQGEAISADHGH